MKKNKEPARPAAAMASVPSLPTIIVSEIKTLIWSKFSIATGMQSLKIFLFRFFSVSSSSGIVIDKCAYKNFHNIYTGCRVAVVIMLAFANR